MSRLLRHLGSLAAGFIAAIAVACSGMGEPAGPVGTAPAAAPTPTTPVGSALTASPAQTATAAPAPTILPKTPVAPAPAPMKDYDSTENMFRFFSGWDHNPDDTHEAISLAMANNDKSMVPVMIEMLRFFWDGALVEETNTALSVITGREFRGVLGDWNEWMEWLGRNADEYGPPDGYVQWKSALMSRIDPRFGEFLAPAAQGSRINVFEIAWGGVRPDGIPDLQNAPVVSAGEQDYLQPSDRVFGLSINGEHRAYPLRIVNAHEMANDVLGGEPIALAY